MRATPNRRKRAPKGSSRRASTFRLQGAILSIRQEWEGTFNNNNQREGTSNIINQQDRFAQFTSHANQHLHDSTHEEDIPSYVTDYHSRRLASDRHSAHVHESINMSNSLQTKSIVPRFGALSDVKPQGVWRFMYIQANGLAEPLRRRQKLDKMMKLAQSFDVDGIAVCEVGVNWKNHRRRHRLREWIEKLADREIRATSSFNVEGPDTCLGQQGGTSIVLLHGLIQYAQQTAHDFRKLGRWSSWVLSSNPLHRARVVVAYCPGRSKKTGLKTVYQQQLRHIQNKNLRCSPYELFVHDLCTQLCTWRAAGDRILLFIDANEDIINSRLGKSLTECKADLTEISHTFWPAGSRPHTHISGSVPIDGVFCTSDLDCPNLLSLSFHEGVGDHRTVIIEVTTLSALGQLQSNIVRPTSRRLTTKQTSSVVAYNAFLATQCSTHNIPSRTSALLQAASLEGFPVSQKTSQAIQTLHSQMHEIRISAERSCRKILKPESAFSPPIKFWYDKIHAYQALVRMKEGTHPHMNCRHAIRTALRKNITDPYLLTIKECQESIRLAKIQQREVRKVDVEHRKSHLAQCLQIAIDKDDQSRQNEITKRMRAEHNKRVWGSINRVTRPRSGRACLQTKEEINGVTVTHTSQQNVELSIQRECEHRFRLGHSAPISRTLLGDELRYLSDNRIAEQIIRGTYNIPHDLDPATTSLLTAIGKLGNAVLLDGPPEDAVITQEDCRVFWKRIKENTSSSPSGLHHGHWKAIIHDPDMTQLTADHMNLIILSGTAPARWGVALQVLLEKVAGNCSVSQLRSIQLYEADYNWLNKLVFHDRAMEALRRSGFLPEEHFSQKESLAEDACFDKILTFDLSRQSRCPLSVTSVDAAQCYDRVNHIIMGLVWMALGVSHSAISIILDCLSNMSIYTRTGFGDSSQSFGGRLQEIPFCGLGQGSKAAPASWIQLSSVIIHAFKQQAHGAIFRDPVTGDVSRSIGCVYVDDTDLYTAGPDLPSVESVATTTQHDVPIWSQSLDATGGAIKGPKSYWVLLSHECSDGAWTHKETPYDLRIPISGEEIVLTQNKLCASTKSLGVITSPSGGHQEHLAQLREKTDEWCSRISNGHLPVSQVIMSYLHQLWPALRYGLGTLTNDWSSASDCLVSTEFKILPLLGVNRHINTSLRRIHQTFGGVGLLDLAVEQHICRINLFCQHYGSQSTIGKKLLASTHWLQLQIGCTGCPLLEDYDTWGHLAPLSWIKSFWESLHRCPGDIHIDFAGIEPQRSGDATLMSTSNKYGLSPQQLISFNRCRCYGNLLFLSDVSKADGSGLEERFRHSHFEPHTSSFEFPPEIPSHDDWEVWVSFWRQRELEIFAHRLGPWHRVPHFCWTWYYDHGMDTIFSTDQSVYVKWKRREGRTRLETGYINTGETVTQHSGLPCSVICLEVNGVARVILPQVGPSFPLRSHPKNLSLWQVLESWGGHWMWSSIQFDSMGSDVAWLSHSLVAGTLIGVADGSYDRVRAPRVCGTGWILCDSLSRRKLAGSFTEVSSSASSFRGEMLGLCAMHVLVRAIETQCYLLSSSMTISCDNEVAVRRATATPRRIKPRWACGDILRSFRNIRPLIRTNLAFKYVRSHMDDHVPWDQMSLEEQLNCQCDRLAKDAVNACLARKETTNTIYTLPCELVYVTAENEKVTGDPSHLLRLSISRRHAKVFLMEHRQWSPPQFDAVDWNHLHAVLHGKSTSFRLWLTKQHSNFCATGVQMVRCKMSEDDRCPSCWNRHERADHLCKCPSAARSELLDESVDDLIRWMSQDEKTDPEVLYWLPKYIRGRGALVFAELGGMSRRMTSFAHSQDLIGWRNFMEGRVSNHLFSIQQDHLSPGIARMNASDWMKKLITKVLHMTHAQWLLRNFMLHDYNTGFLMVKRKVDLLHKLDHLSRTQLHEIPEESKFLLDIDTNCLARNNFAEQEYWVCAMEAAVRSKSVQSLRRMSVQRPRRYTGGSFALLEEIRREWVCATGHGPDHSQEKTQDLSWTYPVRSEASSSALLASNICRKPD